MEKNKTAGVFKSWGCVAVLTFLVPAAGFELSTIFFSASSLAAQTISRFIEPAGENVSPLVVACPDLEIDEVI